MEDEPCVSTERIYPYIWKDKKQKGTLYLNLRTKGKRCRKRGSEKNKRVILKTELIFWPMNP